MSSKLKAGFCVIGGEVPTQMREAIDQFASDNGIIKMNGKPNRSVVIRQALTEFIECHLSNNLQKIQLEDRSQNGVLIARSEGSKCSDASKDENASEVVLNPSKKEEVT